MKKSQLYDRAEQLYTEEQWTFEAIAKELQCSDRTLRNWAKEGRWDEKRVGFLSMRQNLTADIQDIALLLARKIKTQLEDEMEPSPHLMNAFTRMASSLLKVREYEKDIEQSAAEQADPANEERDKARKAAAAKFREVFGVDLELPQP